MKILICSDGTPASDNAVRLGGVVARATKAQVTLLGIAENPAEEQPLRQALNREAEMLRNASVEIAVRSGEPIAQILIQTGAQKYDLVIIGARRKEAAGPFWQSLRTYEIIKAIEPPVLVAIGNCDTLAHFLVCTGGKHYIDDAVRLTGTLAAAVGAQVTLLHIMAEPPAIYADLVQMEEDVDALLASGSELGHNLLAEKKLLEKLGVITKVRVRHGFVIDQLFDELQEGNYDLIVSGSSRTRGPLRHYIMGDLTRSIVNRAECPVLVARSTETSAGGNLLRSLRAKLFPSVR
jgi:nucleotide-binding universal stress UspA family protein